MYIEEEQCINDQKNVRQVRKTRQDSTQQKPVNRPRARSVSLTSMRRQRSTSCDLTTTKKRRSCTQKQHTKTSSSSPLTPVSLLCYAVLCNDEILLKKLLNRYLYDINRLSEDGMSPLHLAALEGNVKIMELLIENGARVNNMDNQCQTVLQYAVWAGQFDAAQLLIQRGCDSSIVIDGCGF